MNPSQSEGADLSAPRTTTFRGFLPDERCRFRPLSTDGLRVVIRLTYRCDLACPHCLVGSRATGDELGHDDWRRVLSELGAIGARKVLLTGGEPLLHPDLVGIVRTISQAGIPVDLNSNLQRIRPDLMRELQRAGLTEISVSLEGPEEVHDRMHGKPGAFAQTLRAIRWAADAGIQVDASCCLTTDNWPGLKALLDIIHTLPVQSFTISRLFPIGHGASRLQKAIPQGQLNEIYSELVRDWIPRARVPMRLVGLLNYPQASDCGRGQSLIGLTPGGRVVACVLAEDNPTRVPHPLEIGLRGAVAELRQELGRRAYRLCCEEVE